MEPNPSTTSINSNSIPAVLANAVVHIRSSVDTGQMSVSRCVLRLTYVTMSLQPPILVYRGKGRFGFGSLSSTFYYNFHHLHTRRSRKIADPNPSCMERLDGFDICFTIPLLLWHDAERDGLVWCFTGGVGGMMETLLHHWWLCYWGRTESIENKRHANLGRHGIAS